MAHNGLLRWIDQLIKWEFLKARQTIGRCNIIGVVQLAHRALLQITGTYRTTGFKRNALTTDSRAIYCTQIWGGYFFHSILASENELGKSLSHGCIRLPYSAAQWIHSNIYAGTTVVIYN